MATSTLTSGHSVGAMAVMAACGLIGAEIAELNTWSAVTPAFVGEMILQLAPVLAAFVGGAMTVTRG